MYWWSVDVATIIAKSPNPWFLLCLALKVISIDLLLFVPGTCTDRHLVSGNVKGASCKLLRSMKLQGREEERQSPRAPLVG